MSLLNWPLKKDVSLERERGGSWCQTQCTVHSLGKNKVRYTLRWCCYKVVLTARGQKWTLDLDQVFHSLQFVVITFFIICSLNFTKAICTHILFHWVFILQELCQEDTIRLLALCRNVVFFVFQDSQLHQK